MSLPVFLPRRTHSLFNVALCGALLPMVAGIAATVMYVITFDDLYSKIGFAVAAIGTLLFVVGIICLSLAERQVQSLPPGELRTAGLRRFKWRAFLLLINFPLAGLCIWVGVSLVNLYVINISNRTNEMLNEVIVEFYAASESRAYRIDRFYRVPADTFVKVAFFPSTDGRATVTVAQGPLTRRIDVVGHVLSGEHVRLTIRPGLVAESKLRR